MLLFVLPGLLLFRFAERQLSAVLFQLPPRLTRLGPRGDRPADKLPSNSSGVAPRKLRNPPRTQPARLDVSRPRQQCGSTHREFCTANDPSFVTSDERTQLLAQTALGLAHQA